MTRHAPSSRSAAPEYGVATHPWALILVILLISAASLSDIDITEAIIQKFSAHYGEPAGDRLRAWRTLMDKKDSLSESAKLKLVNDFFNQLRPVTDIELWRKEDYWATPLEALGVNGADCEDYSLAKYFTLRSMGISEDKLHITYTKAIEYNEAHMVLAYYPSDNEAPLILDNLNKDILSASERNDLKPVYSFNGAGLWLSVNRAKGKRVGGPQKVSLWQDFMQRFEQEMGSI